MIWPERFSERLHIIAHGETFDVDAFVAKSALRPDFVWRRPPPLTSGVEFFLGDGRVIRLPDQEQIAVTYLKSHRDELRAIAELPGVDAFILGLVYIAKLDSGATGVALDWPRDLMLAAIDIGITPIHYITYDPRKEPEPYASLCLWGTFDPDEITRRVGVAPSETARPGDTIVSYGVNTKISLWALRSRLDSSDSMEMHVTDILDQLDINEALFADLIRELGGLVEIVGLPPNYGPAVSLEPETIARVAKYGLRLDVDRNC